MTQRRRRLFLDWAPSVASGGNAEPNVNLRATVASGQTVYEVIFNINPRQAAMLARELRKAVQRCRQSAVEAANWNVAIADGPL